MTPKPVAAANRLAAEACPFCGRQWPYRLGDGRLMCRTCRRKYTPLARNGRLDQRTLDGLALHFWRMTAIHRAAGDLGLNRKTVHRYFAMLRRALALRADERDRRAAAPAPPAAVYVGELAHGGLLGGLDTVTVFGLTLAEGRVRLVLAERIKDWSGLNLDSLRPVRRGGPEECRLADDFWTFARQGLKHYRGGFKRRLPLYLREMEFRYNHQGRPQEAAEVLAALLTGPS